MRGPYLLRTRGKWEQNGCQSKYIHRKTGLGGSHTTHTHTHTHTRTGYPKSHCIRTSLCSTQILVSWIPNTDTHSPHSLGFVYFCIRLYFFPFLIIRSMPSLNVIIVQEWGGEEPNSSNEQGRAGNVSFGCLLSPFRLFPSKLHRLSEAKRQWRGSRGPSGWLQRLLHPLLGPLRLFTRATTGYPTHKGRGA